MPSSWGSADHLKEFFRDVETAETRFIVARAAEDVNGLVRLTGERAVATMRR